MQMTCFKSAVRLTCVELIIKINEISSEKTTFTNDTKSALQ